MDSERLFLIVALVSIHGASVAGHYACGNAYKLRCFTEEFGCFSAQAYCNGHADCEDGSDEEHCPECTLNWFHPCKDGHLCIWVGFHCSGYDRCSDGLLDNNCTSCRMSGFLCPDSTRCARPEKRCTGYDVCYDGSTDENCTECKESGFLRKNKRCIRPEKLCNGRDECGDGGSSNLNCTTCFGGARKCPGNPSRCYLPRYNCTGLDVCGDGSTDINCAACSQGSVFSMQQKRCIRHYFCSGRNESGDGTSDINCKACRGDAFHCENGRCISAEKRCNGRDECGDGSSNSNCLACKENAFWCKENNSCIPHHELCDGQRDCSCVPPPPSKSRFNYGLVFGIFALIVMTGVITWYIKYRPELRCLDWPLKRLSRLRN